MYLFRHLREITTRHLNTNRYRIFAPMSNSCAVVLICKTLLSQPARYSGDKYLTFCPSHRPFACQLLKPRRHVTRPDKIGERVGDGPRNVARIMWFQDRKSSVDFSPFLHFLSDRINFFARFINLVQLSQNQLSFELLKRQLRRTVPSSTQYLNKNLKHSIC